MNTETKYYVFPAGKPEEKFEVKYKIAGDQDGDTDIDAGFVKVEEFDAPTQVFVFDNQDADGAFVNNDVEQLDVTGTWDIMRVDSEVEVSVDNTEVSE
jgi:hypothetical protein